MAKFNPRSNPPLPSNMVSEADLKKIIQDGDTKLLVNQAKEIGQNLARQLTTSQIRNIFGTVRQIEMSWSAQASEDEKQLAMRHLMLLKPKLAYQAKREKGQGVQQLADIFVPAIDMVNEDRKHFQNFVDFFEAILAYHTASGGY